MGIHEEFPVQYANMDYDLAEFLKKHPGGINYLNGYKKGNITKRMDDTHHSKSAKYLLREYMKGGRNETNMEEQEDLEKLVDWNKAILPQVTSLGERYNEWVTSPVDRQLRLFESTFLESLTITPWYVVPIVWMPVILFFIYSGTKILTNGADIQTQHIIPIIFCIVYGILKWTLLEYSLHRWFFHMEPSGKSKIFIYIHFAIHGLHHKVPFDSRRLVFPPVPAAVITVVFYYIFSIMYSPNILHLIMGGSILGYVMYDMIHFYLHHGAPKENTYLYNLKRYHNQHHFSHSDSGFGISSMFWDKIFGTAIRLRKLAMSIKW